MESILAGSEIGPFAVAGFIDVDATFIVQLIIFLSLLFILNNFLFKPYLAVLKEREALGPGMRDRAAEIEQQVVDLSEQYDEALKNARADASAVRQDLSIEAKQKEEEIVGAVREKTSKHVQDERSKIDKQIADARVELDRVARDLSDSMVQQVLPQRPA